MPATNTPRPLRVLYVEDEPMLRHLVVLVLAQHGHRVAVAEDGLQAWKTISAASEPFDVIITDNQMPHMSGVELVEKLRANGYAGAVVFFSSTLAYVDRQRVEALHVDGLVEQGSRTEELLAVLNRIPRT
jgi:CheY-like chemotaxis protein